MNSPASPPGPSKDYRATPLPLSAAPLAAGQYNLRHYRNKTASRKSYYCFGQGYRPAKAAQRYYQGYYGYIQSRLSFRRRLSRYPPDRLCEWGFRNRHIQNPYPYLLQSGRRRKLNPLFAPGKRGLPRGFGQCRDRAPFYPRSNYCKQRFALG